MNRKRRLLLVVPVVVALLAAASAATWHSLAAPAAQPPAPVGSTAQDNPSAPSTPVVVPGGPGFYMQSSMGFRPESPDYTWVQSIAGEMYNPNPGQGYYAGAVSLPNGATVTRLVAYYYDADQAHDIFVELRRKPGNGDSSQLAEVYSSGQPGYSYAVAETISNPVIDQQNYSYVVWVNLPGGTGTSLRFINVRIDYGFGTDLPLALKNQ